MYKRNAFGDHGAPKKHYDIPTFYVPEKGFTVAEFRDLVGGNRKICLLLLAQYDAELLTKRNGDLRIIIKNK